MLLHVDTMNDYLELYEPRFEKKPASLYVDNKGANQLVHPRSLFSFNLFADSIISLVSIKFQDASELL